MPDRPNRVSSPELEVLRSREERYSALVENSPYCIHEIASDGRLISMNPAGLRMMACGDECEIVGTHYLDAVSDADRPRIAELLRAALDGQFSEFEFAAVNGRAFRSNFVPLPAKDGEPVRLMGITQDITERRDLEQQLNESRRLDSIGRLAGGVAHDFNNLLTVILSAAEFLNDRVDPAGKADIGAITDAANRATELTSQLLTFARRQIVRPRVIDITQRLAATDQLLRRVLTENIDLATAIGPDLLTVRIDPGQFDQVIVNLAANARDAMPDGGRLEIEARLVELSASDSAGRPALSPGPHVRITIADNGTGIEPEIMQHIFEPFFTTKELTKGTGLGLAMCQGIILQAGGLIEVDCTRGGGSTFTIHLPIFDGEPDVDKTVEAHEAHQGLGTILLVEDDAQVRSSASRSLLSQGYDVIEAESGEQAIEIARQREGAIDLLFTDVVLPGINGRQVAEGVQALHPSIRVLYSSGYTDDTILRLGVHNDEFHLLAKPYTPRDLQKRVAEILVRPVW